MVGMVTLGILANTIGRRKGSIITASLMALGATCLTMASMILSSDPSVLFPAMSLSLFVFGVGVGGEYPLSASSASERAMATMKNRRERELEDAVGARMERLLGNHNISQSRYLNSTTDGEAAKNNFILNGKMTSNKAWQTLQTRHSASHSVNKDITPKSNRLLLTPVEESYGDGYHDATVVASPTDTTKETNNSLSSRNRNMRRRGQEVLLVFSMQGMGIFANSLILTFLLMVTKHKGQNGDGGGEDENENADNDDVNAYYEPLTLLKIWRIVYATGAAILIYVLFSRIFLLPESEVWAQDRKEREEELKERQSRESSIGFSPPRLGPYEKELKRENEVENEKESSSGSNNLPSISPTFSTITMKSEFDGLGSTNLDGCNIFPELMIDEDSKPSSELGTCVPLFRKIAVYNAQCAH